MDVSRSFLWPLVTGVAAAVALVVGVAYFAKTFSHNDLAAAPAVTVGPAALTVAAADAALQRGDRRAALSQAQAAVNLGPLDASVVQHAGQIARVG
jgi:predicted membrane-bound mannosyltransferase